MGDAESLRLSDFRDLVTEHHVALRAFVRSLGVTPEWVDDLAQETFLIAFRELKRFDADRDFGKWLRGIARNVVRNELRKDARHRRIAHEGLTELLARRENAEPTALERSRLSALRDCVEQLPKRSRQLVAGRYGGGYAASELAAQMQMTADAARQALCRIRARLKQCVELRMAEEV